MEELVFDDITPTEIPVKIGSQWYVLREASGDAVARWRNGMTRGVSIGADRRPTGIGNVGDSQVLLLSLCMYKTDDSKKIKLDKDGNPDNRTLVGIHVVKQWPNRVVDKLFDQAMAISNLTDEQETEESLQKKMTDLQGKLDALRNGHDEDPAKKLQMTTEHG